MLWGWFCPPLTGKDTEAIVQKLASPVTQSQNPSASPSDFRTKLLTEPHINNLPIVRVLCSSIELGLIQAVGHSYVYQKAGCSTGSCYCNCYVVES